MFWTEKSQIVMQDVKLMNETLESFSLSVKSIKCLQLFLLQTLFLALDTSKYLCNFNKFLYSDMIFEVSQF